RGGHLFRPMLADLRAGPLLHAGRGTGGLQGRLRRMGRAEEEGRRAPARVGPCLRRPSRQPLSAFWRLPWLPRTALPTTATTTSTTRLTPSRGGSTARTARQSAR